MGKKYGILIICAAILFLCFTGTASAETWYVDDDGGADFTRIQDAINNATAGDTIIVRNGTYDENLVVNKSLTIRSKNGPETTIVLAKNPDDHVFNVTADYVNISGFTVENATGWYIAGIYLDSADYCNISSNNCSNNSDGIYLGYANSNSVSNNNCSGNKHGIRLLRSDNNNISNNICSSNYWDGIILGEYSLFGCNNNNISNNNCSYNHCGIHLWSSDRNSITNNNCSYNNMDGIHFTHWSQDNSVMNNNCSYNKYAGISVIFSTSNNLTGNIMVGNGISILGYERSHYYQKIDTSNTVNGKPVYYWKNVKGGRIPNDAGQVIFVNCKDAVVENQKLNNASVGIEVAYCSNITIKNNNCSYNNDGIDVMNSRKNRITNNNCSYNGYGIELWFSSNDNSVTSNNCSNNNWKGIHLFRDSNNNRIVNNICTNNGDDGIYLSHSNNNLIHLNNFMNNTDNIDTSESTNIWNSTEKINYTYNGTTYTNYLGNYWDDYTDVDANNDGIWDHPRSIDPDQDYHPLVAPFENYFVSTPAIFET